MIEQIRYDSRATEVNTIVLRIIGILQTNDWSSDLHLTSIIKEIKKLQVKLNLAFNQSKMELVLDEKDIDRERKLRSFLYLLVGFIHHPDLTINEAAKEVKNVFDVYGISVKYEGSVIESSLINSLLSDLCTSSMVEAMSVLSGCNTIRDELKTAQNDFENTRLSYESIITDGEKRLVTTTIKKELMYLINKKLLVYAVSMYQVNRSVFGDMCIAVAQVVNGNNDEVKRRSSKQRETNVY